MADDSITVPISDLTDRQVLLAVLRTTLRMEQQMADLQQAVADLIAAVDAVAVRLLPQIDTLRAQVAAGVQALADFEAADATEDAAYQQAVADLQAALQAQVASAQAAADAISGQVTELNALGAEAPVEPAPVEPPA